MSKLLLITNLIEGVRNPHSWFFCENFYKITDKILKQLDRYDEYIVVNDYYSQYSGRFSYLPKYNTQDSMDVMYGTELGFAITCKGKPFQILRKDSGSAVHNNHQKELIL